VTTAGLSMTDLIVILSVNDIRYSAYEFSVTILSDAFSIVMLSVVF